MTEKRTDMTDRREFIRRGARMGLTGLLGALGGLLYGRGRGTRLPGQKCVNNGICCNCGLSDGCGLPAALSAKRHRESGGAS